MSALGIWFFTVFLLLLVIWLRFEVWTLMECKNAGFLSWKRSLLFWSLASGTTIWILKSILIEWQVYGGAIALLYLPLFAIIEVRDANAKGKEARQEKARLEAEAVVKARQDCYDKAIARILDRIKILNERLGRNPIEVIGEPGFWFVDQTGSAGYVNGKRCWMPSLYGSHEWVPLSNPRVLAWLEHQEKLLGNQRADNRPTLEGYCPCCGKEF